MSAGRLNGKRAFVTGARRGIGRSIAELLAREGCDVAINDLDLGEEADDTLRLVEAQGRKGLLLQGDISDPASVTAMFDQANDTLGGVDILVNNAANWAMKPFLQLEPDDWDRVIDTSLKGPFLCSQTAAKLMVEQATGGSIVTVTSIHAYRHWPLMLVYGVAKAGLVKLTMSMAHELAGTGIRCNAIAPGVIDSRVLPPELEHERGHADYADFVIPATPSRRVGLPPDIAEAAVFLSSPAASYINGTTLTVDGGMMTGGAPDPEPDNGL